MGVSIPNESGVSVSTDVPGVSISTLQAGVSKAIGPGVSKTYPWGDGLPRQQQNVLTVSGSAIEPNAVGSKEMMGVSGTNGITGVVTTTPELSEALQAVFQGTSGTQTTTAAVAEVPRVGITGTTAGSDAGSASVETSAFTINAASASGTGGSPYFTYTFSDDNFFLDTTSTNTSDYMLFREDSSSPNNTFSVGEPVSGTYTAEEYVPLLASSFNNNFGLPWTATSSGRVLTITLDASTDYVYDFSSDLVGVSLRSSIANSVVVAGFDGDGTQVQTVTATESATYLADLTLSYVAPSLSVLSFTFDSTYSSSPVTTGNIPASSSTTVVAALGRTALNNAITAGTLTGYTVTAATNSVITLVATSTGNRTNIVGGYTGVTNGISESITDGATGGSEVRDTYSMTAGSPHSPSSLASSFANDLTAGAARTQIRNHIINGDIGGYGSVTEIGTNSYFEMTSDTAGAETDFVLTITPGTGSDLVATNSVTTQGADAFTTGTLDTCTLTARDVTKSFTITSGSTSTSQYTQAYDYFSSTDPITGVTISGSGSTLGVTSTATGNETDYTLTVTSNGTAGSPTITRTQGTATTTSGTLTPWTAVIDGTTYTQNYSSGADATKQLSEPNTYLVAQGVDSSISGTTMIVASASTGNKANFTFVIGTTGTSQTATQPTVTNTDGEVGGSLGINITGGGIDTLVTITETSTLTRAQLLTLLNTAINGNSGVFTYQDGGGDLEFASENNETYPDVVVTVSNNTGDITITPTTKYKGYS